MNAKSSSAPFFTSSRNIRLLFGVSCVSFFLGASMLHHQRQGHRVNMACHSQWLSPNSPLLLMSSKMTDTSTTDADSTDSTDSTNSVTESAPSSPNLTTTQQLFNLPCAPTTYKAYGLVRPASSLNHHHHNHNHHQNKNNSNGEQQQQQRNNVTITPTKTVQNDGEGDVLLYTCKIQALDMSGQWKTKLRFAIKKSDLALELADAQTVNEQLRLAERRLIQSTLTSSVMKSVNMATANATSNATSNANANANNNNNANCGSSGSTAAATATLASLDDEKQKKMKDELLLVWQKLVEDSVLSVQRDMQQSGNSSSSSSNRSNSHNMSNNKVLIMNLLIHGKDHPTKMGTLIHTNQATRLAKLDETLVIPSTRKEFLEYLKRANIVRFEPGASEVDSLKILKFVHKDKSIKAGKQVRIYESVIRDGDAITVYGNPTRAVANNNNNNNNGNGNSSSSSNVVAFETHMLSEEDDDNFTRHLQKKQTSGYNFYKAYVAGILYLVYELFV